MEWELTILTLFWTLSAVSVFIFQFSLKLFEKKIPDKVKAVYLFGKLKATEKIELLTPLPIPKRWFTHFYAFGLAIHTAVFILLCFFLTDKSYLWMVEKTFFKLMRYPSSAVNERNAWPVVIVFTLEWIQMARRLYECLFTSSFSKSTMSLIHYFYGMFFYSSFGLGLLISVDVYNLTFKPLDSDVIFYLPVLVLFALASAFQHRAFQTFASLRNVEKGKPAKGHYIPTGHLFEWVSCPHFLCEIIIYFSLTLIFQMRNTFLNSVLLFVAVNQICSSLMSHEWYLNAFVNYPKNRKAVFPYLL